MSTPQFPYQDPALTVERRVEDLLGRMTVEDKAGLMFQPMAALGDFDAPGLFGTPSTRVLLAARINHFNILNAPSAREIAQWHNAVQEEARQHPLGIPVTISSDPRHHFGNNPLATLVAGPFSQWPETLGFAAIGDPELVRRFADVVRAEYLAVGIRAALHPQLDLATEPRWARANGTFGESAGLAGILGVAYIRGLQGDAVGPRSVSAMAKHFPGGGPQHDGEDPHFDYGREQVYPGGKFDLHLRPFEEAIAAGVAQLMPYYGMPVGTEYEAVGFGYNKQIITGLLRERLGFDGIVCSDWGILSSMCWGVEDLSYTQRVVKALDAGIDQFGGETRPEELAGLIRSGAVGEERVNVSVRRLLREKFRLGLFDNPFVDADRASQVVGSAPAREEGMAAQCAAMTLLANGDGAARLPLSGSPRLYAEGVDPRALAGRAEVVATPAQADVAVLRIVAPWEQRGEPGSMESFFHAGSLAFPQAEIDRVSAICAQLPTVVDVYLDRPAIVGWLEPAAASLTVNFGATDEAFARVLFGEHEPRGRLPFDLPSSMAAVEASRPDVPFDTANPVFRFGHGLRYENWVPAAPPTPAQAAPAGRYDLDTTPLGTLLDDPDANKIIARHVPDLPANPMVDMVRSMPFNAVLNLAAGQLDPATVTALKAELAAL
jgi:beta-glucosidase